MTRASVNVFRAATDGTIALRPEVAGATALLGMILCLLALGTGFLSLGILGLGLMGLAAGFTGTLKSRLLVGVLIWITATALALVGLMYAEVGFAMTAPVVVTLVFVACGQFLGALAGIVVRLAMPEDSSLPGPRSSKQSPGNV